MAGSSPQLVRKERISASVLPVPLTLRIVSTASSAQRSAQPRSGSSDPAHEDPPADQAAVGLVKGIERRPAPGPKQVCPKCSCTALKARPWLAFSARRHP
jgi:hypothetical protein